MPTKTALLIDFDNVFISLWDLDREAAMRFASEPGDWLQVLANTHLTGEPRRWLVARCYLNPAGFVNIAGPRSERVHFSRFRPGLVRAGLEVVDCPAVTRQGKNAADIRIVLDALDLLNHRTRFDEFVLASGDADFTPLLQRIWAEDRRIAIVSPGYLASAYTAIADRTVDFDALAAILSGDTEESAPAAFEIVGTPPGVAVKRPTTKRASRASSSSAMRRQMARSTLRPLPLKLQGCARLPNARNGLARRPSRRLWRV